MSARGWERLGPFAAPMLATGLATAFLLQAYHGSLGKSLTWDEPGYIAAGYANLVWGDYSLNADHPPLLQKLQGLPLLFLDVNAPDSRDPRWLATDNPRATYGRAFVFQSGNDVERITLWARTPVLLLGFALVLAVYGFGAQLLGTPAALFAAALVAFSPNLIAHARFATEDLGCSAGMLAAVWCFWWSARAPTPWRATACGVVTGVALLTKYTALLLAPIYGLLALVLWRERRDALSPLQLAGHLAVIAGVSLFVVGLGYGATFRPDRYLAGIFQIYPDVNEDYLYYFWGSVSEHPRWYYAAVSLLMKTPMPTLLALVLAAAAVARGARRESAWILLVPAAVVIGASFFDRTNPGVRRILPAIPFLLLFAGHAALAARSRGRVAVLVALVAWCAAEAAWIHPHQLSYLNRAAGGPDRGPYLLDESNIDWGQDLPALAAWQREHGGDEPLRLLYFGSAYPEAYGVRFVELETAEAVDPPPGTYAISAHHLTTLRKAGYRTGLDADWLERYEPIAKAGYSIFIYRIPPPDPG